jgi:hypothetical protein
LSIRLRLGLPSGLLPSGFATNILYYQYAYKLFNIVVKSFHNGVLKKGNESAFCFLRNCNCVQKVLVR